MTKSISSSDNDLPVRIVEIAGLGRVRLEKSARAKRLSMSVKPFKGVRVAIPKRASFRSAVAFLEEHITWAQRCLEQVREVERQHIRAREELPAIDVAEAVRTLAGRIDELAGQHGFTYRRLTIRNQKTLWGSCSHDNNINLNINLVRLRQELIDYVMLHELVHTRQKNHGKRFWATLDTYTGDAKKLARELKQHRLGLSLG
jgi:hypothetical protein